MAFGSGETQLSTNDVCLKVFKISEKECVNVSAFVCEIQRERERDDTTLLTVSKRDVLNNTFKIIYI